MLIKGIHQEALGFNMFPCFNISKHFSISVLFFIICLTLCVLFLDFLKIIAMGMGFQNDFSPNQGLALSLCSGRGGGGGGREF